MTTGERGHLRVVEEPSPEKKEGEHVLHTSIEEDALLAALDVSIDATLEEKEKALKIVETSEYKAVSEYFEKEFLKEFSDAFKSRIENGVINTEVPPISKEEFELIKTTYRAITAPEILRRARELEEILPENKKSYPVQIPERMKKEMESFCHSMMYKKYGNKWNDLVGDSLIIKVVDPAQVTRQEWKDAFAGERGLREDVYLNDIKNARESGALGLFWSFATLLKSNSRYPSYVSGDKVTRTSVVEECAFELGPSSILELTAKASGIIRKLEDLVEKGEEPIFPDAAIDKFAAEYMEKNWLWMSRLVNTYAGVAEDNFKNYDKYVPVHRRAEELLKNQGVSKTPSYTPVPDKNGIFAPSRPKPTSAQREMLKEAKHEGEEIRVKTQERLAAIRKIEEQELNFEEERLVKKDVDKKYDSERHNTNIKAQALKSEIHDLEEEAKKFSVLKDELEAKGTWISVKDQELKTKEAELKKLEGKWVKSKETKEQIEKLRKEVADLHGLNELAGAYAERVMEISDELDAEKELGKDVERADKKKQLELELSVLAEERRELETRIGEEIETAQKIIRKRKYQLEVHKGDLLRESSIAYDADFKKEYGDEDPNRVKE